MKRNLLMQFLAWFTGKKLPEEPIEKKLPPAEIRDYIDSKLNPKQEIPAAEEQLPYWDAEEEYRRENEEKYASDTSVEIPPPSLDPGETNSSFSMPDEEDNYLHFPHDNISSIHDESFRVETADEQPLFYDDGMAYQKEAEEKRDSEHSSASDNSDKPKLSQVDLGERNASFSIPDREDAFFPTSSVAKDIYFKKPSKTKPFTPTFALKEKKSRSEATKEIDHLIRQRDESFQQMLFREIDSRGMTDVECYQRAHMDRKTFSKIRGDVHYKPKKTTAVSLALALKMTLNEASEFLKKAGYALSDSNIFDVIIQYYLEKRLYDIFEINETLYYYDQPLLGTK